MLRAEVLKGHLDAMILAVVSSEATHGYAVIAELKRRSGGELTLPEGTVYPALHRLEEAGLLSSAWSDGGRRRRMYSITQQGRRELGVQRREWPGFVKTVEAVLG
jgi:DNA-binding PadR family transcriptional regulator